MSTAQELIARAEALLLDFDGPVTALMPPPANAEAADRVRRSADGVDLPQEIQTTTDHLAVLQWIAEEAADHLSEVERSSTQVEVECALTSEPSPEVDWLLEQAESRGLPVAIVSNNSEIAVRTFVDRVGWSKRFTAYACRTPETVLLLKPQPFLVLTALESLQVAPERCVFVGDSISDIRAGRAAAVKTIGLVKYPGRLQSLRDAGATAILRRSEGA